MNPLFKKLGILVLAAAVIGGIYLAVSSKEEKQTADTDTVPRERVAGETYNVQLKVQNLKTGQGPEAKNDDVVTVHYTGKLENGTVFDSSYDRGEPFVFQIGAGQVIQGWDVGLLSMKVGEKRLLTIPPELGYGSMQVGDIPPNSTLIFEVEMIKIN